MTRQSIKRRLAADLDAELRDNRYAWQMQPDGRWERVAEAGAGAVSAQELRLGALAQRLS